MGKIKSSAPASFGGSRAAGRGHVDRYNPDVKTMQRRMKSAGINPGPIDGLKGPRTRAAMARYHAKFGKSAADGLRVDPGFAEGGTLGRDTAAVRKGRPSTLDPAAPSPQAATAAPGAAAPAAGDAASAGNLDAGATKDGYRLPNTSGKATTFWNGNYTYKGQRDTANMSTGAWGDANKPTDYFAAIPVGLKGGGNWWHDKKLLVTNPKTGQQVVVPIQDKGPGPRTGAAIDLSPVAKEALGVGFNDNINVRISFARDDAPIGPVR